MPTSEEKQKKLERIKKRISSYIQDGLTVEEAFRKVIILKKSKDGSTMYCETSIFRPSDPFFFLFSVTHLNSTEYFQLRLYAEQEKQKYDADQEEKRKREQKEQGIVAVADTAIVSVNSSPLSFSAAAQEENNRIHLPLQFTYDHRPTIPITLRHESTTVECQALIDSGATHTIFHASLAQALGVEIPNKPKGRFEGISDKSITYFEATIEIGVGDLFYSTPVCFSDDLNPNAKNMLGQIGFFDRFTVEFEGKTVLVKEKYIGIPLPSLSSSPKSLPHISTSILGRGINQETEQEEIVTIGDIERRGGLYILGTAGTGKSTLEINLILQDIENGHGLCCLDPHGDAIREILKRLPVHRKDDVIYFDPFDDTHAVGINLFQCDTHNKKQVSRTLEYVLHVFGKLFTESGDLKKEAITMYETLLNTTILLIYNQGYTLAEVQLLLEEEDAAVKLIPQIPDAHDDVRRWWMRYHKKSQQDKDAITKSTITRLQAFLTDEHIRHIVGQHTSTLDFQDITDNKKILLVKLSLQHEEVTKLVGSMIIGLLLTAAYARESKEDTEKARPHFCIYADEFQNFATPDFAKLFTETRKFHYAPTIAHQERKGQFSQDDVTLGATSGAANLVLFGTTLKDAQEYAPEFAKKPPPAETRREPVLTPVVQPIEWLLGARGGHDNPVINNFVHTRLTVFGDAIKNSHQTAVFTPSPYGIQVSHVSVPVSGLDHVRRELNRILYEAMVEKNPRKIIPPGIFFYFIEPLSGLPCPHVMDVLFPDLSHIKMSNNELFDAYRDFQVDTSSKWLKQVQREITLQMEEKISKVKDHYMQIAWEAFSKLWLSTSKENIGKLLEQLYDACYHLFVPYGENKDFYLDFQILDTLLLDSIELEKSQLLTAEARDERYWNEIYEEKVEHYQNRERNREREELYREIRDREREREEYEDKHLYSTLPKYMLEHNIISETVKKILPNVKSPYDRYWNEIYEKKVYKYEGKDARQLKEECLEEHRLHIKREEERRARFHQDFQTKYQEKIAEVAASIKREIECLEAPILELREFMQALADDPIKDTSRYEEKETATRTEQDMWNEMVRELHDLPPRTAYCRIRKEIAGKPRILKYKLFPDPLSIVSDAKLLVAAAQRKEIENRTRNLYCRERTIVEDEIRARREYLKKPVKKQRQTRQEEE